MNEILRNLKVEGVALDKTKIDGWRAVKRNILMMIEGGKEKYLNTKIRPEFEQLKRGQVGMKLESELRKYLKAGLLGEEEFNDLVQSFWGKAWEICLERWENGEEWFKCIAIPTLYSIRQVQLIEAEKGSGSAEVFFVLPKKISGQKSFNFDRRILEESLKLNLLVVQLKGLMDGSNALETQKKFMFLDFAIKHNASKIKSGEFDVRFDVNFTGIINGVKEYSVWLRF